MDARAVGRPHRPRDRPVGDARHAGRDAEGGRLRRRPASSGSSTRQQAVTNRSGPPAARAAGPCSPRPALGRPGPLRAAARAVCRVSAVMAAAFAPVPQTSAMSTIERPSGSGSTS